MLVADSDILILFLDWRGFMPLLMMITIEF